MTRSRELNARSRSNALVRIEGGSAALGAAVSGAAVVGSTCVSVMIAQLLRRRYDSDVTATFRIAQGFRSAERILLADRQPH
jgi:hypothetical protein